MRLRADLAALPAQTLHLRPHKHEWVCFSSSRRKTRNRETMNWLLSQRKMYTPVVRLPLSHRQYHPMCSKGKSRAVEYNNTVTYKDVNCILTQQQAALIAASDRSETKESKISSVRWPETMNWYRSLCAWRNLIGKDPVDVDVWSIYIALTVQIFFIVERVI